MVARSFFRVSEQTEPSVNDEIDLRMHRHIAYYSEHPAEIPRRLKQLEAEWDIERALETASSAFSLLGLFFGLTRRRAWLLLPVVVQGFFLQHALQGWCPPLPVLRKLGFRTHAEIEEERFALLQIHGGLPLRSNGSRSRRSGRNKRR